MLLLAAAAAIAIVYLAALRERGAPQAPGTDTDRMHTVGAARGYVRAELGCSRSAKFSGDRAPEEEVRFSRDRCTCRVHSWVDGEDGSGTLVQTRYIVEMTRARAQYTDVQAWKLASIQIEH